MAKEKSYRERLGYSAYEDPGIDCQSKKGFRAKRVDKKTGELIELDCVENLTDQSQARDCDINVIVSRYEKSGRVPVYNSATEMYGDLTGAPDLLEAMSIVARANEAFMEMPADVRSRFANDPVKFVEFVEDRKNFDELVKMGLVVKPKEVPGGLSPGLTQVGGAAAGPAAPQGKLEQ